MSYRAYDLTKEVLLVNPGNYAAWHFRRKLIDELKLDKAGELEFLNGI